MDPMPQNLPPAIASALASWHACVERGDMSGLPAIVHPDAVFRSPATFKPYRSAPALVLAIRTVAQVFTQFAYRRQFSSDDGLSVTLEFTAQVGEKEVQGVDLIRFDPQGRIVEFEVLIRPLSGLQALSEEMGRRLGHLLPAYKTPGPAPASS
jgi:hypothetical protein